MHFIWWKIIIRSSLGTHQMSSICYHLLSYCFISDQQNVSEANTCHCGQIDTDPFPHCMKLFSDLNPICFLKADPLSRYCPGARKLKGREIYLTSDEFICNKSLREYFIFSFLILFSAYQVLQWNLYMVEIPLPKNGFNHGHCPIDNLSIVDENSGHLSVTVTIF